MRPQDVFTSLSFLCLPWKWRQLRYGRAPVQVEEVLRKYFSVSTVYTVDSGRSALYLALEACGVGEGDQVLVQAFTCIVVVNAIRALGATPVFVDVNDNLTMSLDDARMKMSGSTKAMIVQHTFGHPAHVYELCSFAKEKNIRVIEDCAQSFGGIYDGQLLGTFGDVSILSFGSDKILSCVRGGAVMTSKNLIAHALKTRLPDLPHLSRATIIRHLLSFPIFFICRPVYQYIIGKAVLYVARLFNITARITEPVEKKGEWVVGTPARLSNALASILLHQLDDFKKTRLHRQTISHTYQKLFQNGKFQPIEEGSVPLKFALFVDDPLLVEQTLKKENIYSFQDWTGSVIVPRGIASGVSTYVQGSCPRAEWVSQHVFTLPTDIHISDSDANRIAKHLSMYVHH